MKRKIILVLLPLLVIITILFIGLLILLDIPIYPIAEEYCGCQHVIPIHFILIFGILLILATIPISYYFISKKMEEKLDKHMTILPKFLNKNYKRKNTKPVNKPSILKFLNVTERKILERLLENKDGVLQSEISRMENMTKLKAHRAVKNLEKREIIIIERYGKTNKIILTKDSKALLDSES